MFRLSVNTFKALFILAIIVLTMQSCNDTNKLPSAADLPHAVLTTTAPEKAVRLLRR